MEAAPHEATAAQLDGFSSLPALASAVQQLASAASDPTCFLTPSSSISDAARAAVKALYQYALQSSGMKQSAGISSEIHVEQPFDAEQIWLQLELNTEPLVKRSKRLLKKVNEQTVLVSPEIESKVDEMLGLAPGSSDEDGSDDEDGGSEGDEDSELGSDEQLGSDEDDEGGLAGAWHC